MLFLIAILPVVGGRMLMLMLTADSYRNWSWKPLLLLLLLLLHLLLLSEIMDIGVSTKCLCRRTDNAMFS